MISGKSGEENGNNCSQRNKKTEDKTQLEIYINKNTEDTCHPQQVVKDGDHDGGEHLVHVLDIVGYVSDQATNGLFIEKIRFHSYKMAEKILAEGIHN